MNNVGVYVGRFSPLHKGHMSVIEKMGKETGVQLLLIGSSATPRNIRTPFNYLERRNFIREIYPNIKIQGIPDVGGDDIWIKMIDDIVYSIFGTDEVTFYGGSESDVSFFFDYGKNVRIVDREIMPINATALRQMMMLGQDIGQFVDSRIKDSVVSHFQTIMANSEEW